MYFEKSAAGKIVKQANNSSEFLLKQDFGCIFNFLSGGSIGLSWSRIKNKM